MKYINCCSVAQSSLTLWEPMDCSKPGFPVFHHFPELAQSHVHWIGDAIQSSFSASGSFPMSGLFALGGWNIGASASVLPMDIHCWFHLGMTGLISLLSKSLFQHHSSKASILRHSAAFMNQPSHLYMTTGKTIALTIQTFVVRVMSLLLIHCLGLS